MNKILCSTLVHDYNEGKTNRRRLLLIDRDKLWRCLYMDLLLYVPSIVRIMNAEDLINTVSVCLDMSEDEVKDVLLSAAALTSYSRDFAIRHTISELDVNQEQAEILLSWGEKNYDIGPNQSF